jgi:sugar (pentulose or hexulose) kinase
MKTERYLAFDCGSSTGRLFAGLFDGGKISLEPVYSFPNRPVAMGGMHYWNVLSMFDELKCGLRKATQSGGFKSISADSWGCDFALIGYDGHMIQNLSCYRDESTASLKSEIDSLAGGADLYRMVGSAEIWASTILRLYQLKKGNPAIIDAAARFLQIADLFNYLLSGEMRGEYTLATTSQLISPATASWNEELFERLGLPVRIAPPLIDSGTFLGRVTESRMQESGICEGSVYAACCHDSAAAMLAMPMAANDVLYVSSGSWSVVMLRTDEPILAPPKLPRFMHEGNWGRKPRLVFNLMGLWMAQQLKRESGALYDEMEDEARKSPPFARVFVPEAMASFKGGIMRAIDEACESSGQTPPQTTGDYLRAIYDSLAISYRGLIAEAEEILGHPLRTVCVVGGGARSDILNSSTAEATGLPVAVGPIEAAVAGNIMAQMAAHGEIGMGDISEVLENSFGKKSFEPTGRLGGEITRAIEVYERMRSEFSKRKNNW